MIDFPRYQSPSLERFAGLAEEFCALVERAPSDGRERFLHSLHATLPRLYSGGLELPRTDVLFSQGGKRSDEEHASAGVDPDPDRPDRAASSALRRSLGALLADKSAYREVFDPYASPDDVEVIGNLADDVSDIYGDIVSGVRKWRRGETGDALWEWRFGLEIHWGEHATGALRAVFALAAWHDLGWPEPPPSRGVRP